MISFKLPENDKKYEWTNHVKEKMVYYGISAALIKRIVRFPKRKEEGIAPGTVAVMQPTSSKKRPQEIWVMYQPIGGKPVGKSQTLNSKSRIKAEKKRIISAWRYPGVSPIGKPIPIPEEILSAIAEICENDFVDWWVINNLENLKSFTSTALTNSANASHEPKDVI